MVLIHPLRTSLMLPNTSLELYFDPLGNTQTGCCPRQSLLQARLSRSIATCSLVCLENIVLSDTWK